MPYLDYKLFMAKINKGQDVFSWNNVASIAWAYAGKLDNGMLMYQHTVPTSAILVPLSSKIGYE